MPIHSYQFSRCAVSWLFIIVVLFHSPPAFAQEDESTAGFQIATRLKAQFVGVGDSFFVETERRLQSELQNARASTGRVAVIHALKKLSTFYGHYDFSEKSEALYKEWADLASTPLSLKDIVPQNFPVEFKSAISRENGYLLDGLEDALKANDAIKVCRIVSAVADREPRIFAVNESDISSSVVLNGGFTSARKLLEAAMIYPNSLEAQADFYTSLEKHALAQSLRLKAMDVGEQRFGANSRIAAHYQDSVTKQNIDLCFANLSEENVAALKLKTKQMLNVELNSLVKSRREHFGSSLETASALTLLSHLQFMQQRYFLAEAASGDALIMISSVTGVGSEEQAEAFHSLARVLFAEGDSDLAKKCDEKGFAIRASLYAEYNEKLDHSLRYLGQSLERMRVPKFAFEAPYYKQANLQAEYFGIASEDVKNSLERMGRNAVFVRNYEQFMEQAIRARRSIYGERDRRVASSLITYGKVLRTVDEDKSIALLNEAYSILESNESDALTSDCCTALLFSVSKGPLKFGSFKPQQVILPSPELAEAKRRVHSYLNKFRSERTLHPEKLLRALTLVLESLNSTYLMNDIAKAALLETVVADTQYLVRFNAKNSRWMNPRRIDDLINVLASGNSHSQLLQVLELNKDNLPSLECYTEVLLKAASNRYCSPEGDRQSSTLLSGFAAELSPVAREAIEANRQESQKLTTLAGLAFQSIPLEQRWWRIPNIQNQLRDLPEELVSWFQDTQNIANNTDRKLFVICYVPNAQVGDDLRKRSELISEALQASLRGRYPGLASVVSYENSATVSGLLRAVKKVRDSCESRDIFVFVSLAAGGPSLVPSNGSRPSRQIKADENTPLGKLVRWITTDNELSFEPAISVSTEDLNNVLNQVQAFEQTHVIQNFNSDAMTLKLSESRDRFPKRVQRKTFFVQNLDNSSSSSSSSSSNSRSNRRSSKSRNSNSDVAYLCDISAFDMLVLKAALGPISKSGSSKKAAFDSFTTVKSLQQLLDLLTKIKE